MSINSIFKERHKRIHLIGIGGIGMSGIARILIASGFQVSGSDVAESLETKSLLAIGAKIIIGHHQSNVDQADVVVFSSAIAKDNPEILQAQKDNIPIIPRAMMLAELMRLRCGIAVSGSHGKTTTTSLIGTLMHRLGLDPTVVIGGIVNHFGTNAVMGQSQFMVTEADESDGTFLYLSPTISVVTNIDAEHLDFYQNGIEQIKDNFKLFLNALPFYGLAVVCIDDPHVKNILPSINRRIATYGLGLDAKFRAQNIRPKGFGTSFDLIKDQKFICSITTNMVGQHNVLNTLAAIAVLEEIGIPCETMLKYLRDFHGVKRRFTQIGALEGLLVIDDYAHHPTEIKAVLNAAKSTFIDKKIHVLFQPHRFSRTKDLMDDFATCFKESDSLVVTDIYAASEEPIDGITTKTLIKRIDELSGIKATYASSLKEGAQKITESADIEDAFLVLGAGSITNAAPMVVDLLKEKRSL